MKGLQLLATGGALPGRVVTNEDLSRQVDTSDEWITTRTGIRQRYYCTESEDAATLAIAAARQALARSGLAASEIACCVAATLSAPTATPSVACRVQAALGLPENRPAFDVNAACSGFIYAIAAAHGLLNTLGGRYALVIGCEALSRMVDPTDRTTCVLFGDGAGAAILELAEDMPFAVTLGARGSEAIRVGGGVGCAIALPVAQALKAQGTKVTGIIGFRNKDLVILEDEFRACCDELIIMSDDGSYGQKGVVTMPLEEKIKAGANFDEVITIGPLIMMKFVVKTTKPYNVKTVVSMNPIMVDGTGMCGGCRLTVGGKTKFACVDGPDFDGFEVDFDEAMHRGTMYRDFEAHAREAECNLLKKEVE